MTETALKPFLTYEEQINNLVERKGMVISNRKYAFEKLDNGVEPIYSQDNLDQINRLYVAAYTLKKEPEHIKLCTDPQKLDLKI